MDTLNLDDNGSVHASMRTDITLFVIYIFLIRTSLKNRVGS